MKKEFTKADLKDGMVVEYRNRTYGMFISGRFLTKSGFTGIEQYEDNLIVKHKDVSKYDIIKVFLVKSNFVDNFYSLLDSSSLELIWERNETKKMTAEEMRKKLEELIGEKIEIEPSTDEKYCKIDRYCDERKCSSACCLYEGGCTWKVKIDDKKNIEECYKKIMKQEK